MNNTKRPIPRKLNNGMITALSEYIRKGNYAVTACNLVGIDEKTLWNWVQQGEADNLLGVDSLYSHLIQSIKKAEAEAEAKLVEVVRESAEIKREWIPAITFLERRHPDRWGRKDRTRVDITETKRIQITHVDVVLNEAGQTPMIEGHAVELLEEGK